MKSISNFKKNNDNEINFILNNTDNNNIKISYANAIRRIALAEIPCIAINRKDVVFYKNTLLMFKSFFSQRHAFHLVDPSSLPLLTSIAALCLTTGSVL